MPTTETIFYTLELVQQAIENQEVFFKDYLAGLYDHKVLIELDHVPIESEIDIIKEFEILLFNLTDLKEITIRCNIRKSKVKLNYRSTKRVRDK